MGKIVEKKKKKKGRPSLLDLQKRNLREQQLQQQQQQQIQQNSKRSVSAPQVTHNYDYATTTPVRRSTRRNPNLSPEDNDEEKDEDEEDEKDEELARKKRREKKLKLVLKLPSSEQKSPANSESRGSDTNPEERSAGPSHKKRKINSIGDGSGIAYSKKGDKSVSGANPTSNSQGEQLDSGPSTALPDKKLLLFILDRLQKKDTYGVFSEPVDPEELPDYHEVIEHPMDFGTIRKKLDIGAYANLEQFEKDVFLVCSNAMQYNAPDTIYFRQARSIQELAKKNFENLRQDSDDDEAEPKVIRRGRPPTKNLKKPLGRPALERAASEFSSDATLATGAEKISNHDMRKGPLPSDKSTVADSAGKFYGSRNDVYTGLFTDRSDEGSNLKGYNMKNGKRHFVLDDNRRNTYKLYHPSAAMHEGSVLTTFDGERKQLLAVGVYLDLGYTRSLARFAANLDPVAWKIASKRIERCLPGGVNFGPGWVGENDIPPQRPLSLPALSLPPAQPTSSQPCTVRQNPSAPTRETIENEMTNSSAGAGSVMPPFQFRQNSAIHPGMNGYNGGYGFNLTAQMAKNIGVARPSGLNLQSSQMLDSVCRSATTFAHPATANSNSDDPKSSENSCTKNPDRPLPNSVGEAKADPRSGLQPQPSWQGLPRRQKSDSRLSTQPKPDSRLLPQQKPDPVPPDLNIRFQSPSSPSSGRVDSAQPDLALQL